MYCVLEYCNVIVFACDRFATMEGGLALVRLYQQFTFTLNEHRHGGKPLEHVSLITLMPKVLYFATSSGQMMWCSNDTFYCQCSASVQLCRLCRHAQPQQQCRCRCSSWDHVDSASARVGIVPICMWMKIVGCVLLLSFLPLIGADRAGCLHVVLQMIGL